MINNLFDEGLSHFKFPIKVIYRYETLIDHDVDSLLFSVTVPKRIFKSAVDRNKIKRRIREAYRLHKLELQSIIPKDGNKVLYLMFIYLGKDIKDYNIIEKSIIHHLTYLKNEIS